MKQLKVIDIVFSVCKVKDYSGIDLNQRFVFTGTTDEERSLVCPVSLVPANVTEREDGWRAFRIEGVLDFSLIGILAEIASVLAEAGVGIFAVSTFNTDYILTKAENFEKALAALREKGYKINDNMDSSTIKSNALRTIEEGTLLAVHSEQDGQAVIQLYDTSTDEPRLIAENKQQMPNVPNPSGHTMTDGERGIKDIDLTVANKQLIQRLMNAMLGIKPAPLTEFFDGDNYINHNPKAWDGLSGFAKGMEERKKSGIITKYHRLRTIIAQGNYVFCITEGAMNDVPTAFFDLFRIDNGKAAEHWDVVAPITEATFKE